MVSSLRNIESYFFHYVVSSLGNKVNNTPFFVHFIMKQKLTYFILSFQKKENILYFLNDRRDNSVTKGSYISLVVANKVNYLHNRAVFY